MKHRLVVGVDNTDLSGHSRLSIKRGRERVQRKHVRDNGDDKLELCVLQTVQHNSRNTFS